MYIEGITKEKLEQFFIDKSLPKFKATQIFEWIYKKKVRDFDSMSNIGKETINLLKQEFKFSDIKLLTRQSDKDVCKYLFELNDGNRIEAVLMFHDYGNSICVSSQVGCNMACKFCESGRLKKVRNLESYEIVSQILKVEEIENLKITHVVLMGIGEPFDNYNNIMDFIKIINEGKGLDIASRHVTVSTCGLVPKIIEFANDQKQANLAVSLHASNQNLREQLMPIAKAYNLDELMNALKYYLEKTNRRITFEYILLKGVNDSPKNALELSNLLKGLNCYVNLIPYNETEVAPTSGQITGIKIGIIATINKNIAPITVNLLRVFLIKISVSDGSNFW